MAGCVIGHFGFSSRFIPRENLKLFIAQPNIYVAAQVAYDKLLLAGGSTRFSAADQRLASHLDRSAEPTCRARKVRVAHSVRIRIRTKIDL